MPWLFFALTSAVYFLGDNSADNDLWGHLFFGRANASAPHLLMNDPFSFTVPGAPWSNHEWLGEIIYWRVFQWYGSAGLLSLKLALVGLLFAFLWARIRRTTDATPLAAFFAIIAAAVLARGCAIRPQLYTYALAAVTMMLVEQHGANRRRPLWCLPPLVALWVNLHGGAIVGVGIVAVYGVWQLLTARPAARSALIVAALCSLALLANPYGLSLLWSIGTPLVRFLPIGEWQPVQLNDPAQRPFLFLVLLGIVSTIANRARGATQWEVTLAVGAAVVAFRQQRHTPLFAIIAVPLVARQCAAVVAARGFSLSPGLQRLLACVIALFAVVQIALTVTGYVERGSSAVVFEASDYPVGAVAFLGQAAGGQTAGGNVALPLNWGSYALWHLSPRWKVSIDGRLETVYPLAVIEEAFAVAYGWPEWTHFVATYHPDAILLPADGDQHLRHSDDWRAAYADAVAVVYVPRARATEPVVAREVSTGWLRFP